MNIRLVSPFCLLARFVTGFFLYGIFDPDHFSRGLTVSLIETVIFAVLLTGFDYLVVKYVNKPGLLLSALVKIAPEICTCVAGFLAAGFGHGYVIRVIALDLAARLLAVERRDGHGR